MTSSAEIEHAVARLAPDDFAALRQWFDAFDADHLGRQPEADIAAGKLDRLADEALADLARGGDDVSEL